MTGRLIVFEGGEGSGKSTQAARIAADRNALLTRQPGGTEVGASIRELLLSTNTVGLSARAEALLMAADRAQHVEELIAPTLQSGRDVVCDRYFGSSIAYQGAGRGLGAEAVLPLSLFAVDGVLPDLVVLLDVPADIGLARSVGDVDRFEAQDLAFHETVRASFLEQADANATWVVVDATGSLEQVATAVDAALGSLS